MPWVGPVSGSRERRTAYEVGGPPEKAWKLPRAAFVADDVKVKTREAVSLGLEVAGLATVCVAGFVLWLCLGLVLTGLSLWVVSWMVSSDDVS